MENRKESILIAGGSGLIGKHLISKIDRQKYHIIVLTRKPSSLVDDVQYIQWDPEKHTISADPNADYIINLAGAGIADKRWSEQRKIEIIQSRINSAITIEKFISRSGQKPVLYLSASAIGYYGDRGNEVLNESSLPGREFLSETCVQWEKAAARLKNFAQRLVILRIGIVLSLNGGALPEMIMTKKFGLLNYFGDGIQYYPWIHIDDIVKMITEALTDQKFVGTFNAVAPVQDRNIDFMKAIKKVQNSAAFILPVPSFILKLILGEMSRVVLNSDRVIPDRLNKTDFRFEFPEIRLALSDIFARKI
ncbi:MAG: TIGR01777 family protein [Saprospiraceae bacterium]|nr:TIGR01777 family protein [Saprospiraceae bacterium]